MNKIIRLRGDSMGKFKVSFKEVIYKEVVIEAESPSEAEGLVEDGDFEGEYEIDSGDLIVTDVEEI
jgi:hypothetical protein